MSERIRTLLAVVALTLAIWVWADLEQTVPGEEDVPVAVVLPAQSDYRVRDVTPRRVRVKFTGPRGKIADLRRDEDQMACRIVLADAQLKSGILTFRAAEGFRHWEDHRVTVESVEPDEVRVDLARQVTVKVPVRVQVTGATLREPAKADPAEVEATVAESDLAALPEARRYALATLSLTTLPENPQIERDAPLEKRRGGADGVEATFAPASVRVTAYLESPVIKTSLGKFMIIVAGPPEKLNRYRVVFAEDADRWVDLTVQGPRPEIEKLVQQPQSIRVELVLTADTEPVAGAWIPGHPVVVGLPPAVKVVGDLPAVNFNLVEMPAPEPPKTP